MIASNGHKGAISLLADEQLVILVHRAHAVAVQDGVARDVPCLLQLKEEILCRLVAIGRRVDLKLAAATTLTWLDLSDNHVVLEVQGLDALQLRGRGGGVPLRVAV